MSPLLGALDPAAEITLSRLLALAVDDKTRHACRSVLWTPGCRLIAADGDDFLFALPPVVREDHEEYRVFLRGHLLEVRQLGFLALDFSMVDFPATLAACRSDIEASFVALWRKSDEGLHLCGPWDDVSDEERARVTCRFVNDNVQSIDL